MKQQYINGIDIKLKAVAQDIKHEFFKYYNNGVYQHDLNEEDEFDIKPLYIQIVKVENKIQLIKKTPNLKETLLPLNKKNYKFKNNKLKVISLEVNSKIYIGVATTINQYPSYIKEFKILLYILNPAILLLSIIVGYFIILYALKPVKVIVKEVEKQGSENLSFRIKQLNSDDEIDELISTFNSLLSRLETSFTKVERFSHDASHELKTPLTVIRGEIEVALRKTRTVNEYKSLLKSSLEETISLQNMVDNLLFLANSDTLNIRKNFVEIYVDEILIECIKEKQKLANSKNIKIEIKDIKPMSINANEVLFKIAILNIIDNAIKYSNKNSSIEVSLIKDKIIIKDFGIGIKEKELPLIYDRFYQVDSSRSNKGSGLGLFIVKTILDIHDLDINIQSNYNECTKVRVIF